jgi:hypothetical protein
MDLLMNQKTIQSTLCPAKAKESVANVEAQALNGGVPIVAPTFPGLKVFFKMKTIKQ